MDVHNGAIWIVGTLAVAGVVWAFLIYRERKKKEEVARIAAAVDASEAWQSMSMKLTELENNPDVTLEEIREIIPIMKEMDMDIARKARARMPSLEARACHIISEAQRRNILGL